ncbi:hypothetical protein Ade02nite_55810 [Paractinoplanes deccanensis]|uniref:F5/8 type C domain-containing protein n=1 Tax=Paractinoplanes deccanensis TaxID=113561 RepID=A0ABQ3YAA2_9ACTN|nr:hypothetical protein Ade02nite_55810 [Actinoplanes deccanensis]
MPPRGMAPPSAPAPVAPASPPVAPASPPVAPASPPVAPASPPVAAAVRPRRRWPWAVAVALLLVAGSAAAWAYRTSGSAEATTPIYVPSVDAPAAALTSAPGSAAPSSAAPSPVPPSPSTARTSPPPPRVTGKPNPSRANLALTGTATASSVEGHPWDARNAVDGDPSTRWSSGFSDPQWIRVDLHEPRRLTEITLVWEHAYGTRYRVDTSLDGRTWKTRWSTTRGQGGTVTVDAAGTVARYVRMVGTHRVSSYGYSLLELEIR